jgi:hypothetical protein
VVVLQLSHSAFLALASCCLSLLTHHTSHCKPHISAFMNIFGNLTPLFSTVDFAPDMERVVYTGLTTCASLQPDLLDKCMRFVFDSHTSVRSNSGQARAMQASTTSLLSPLTAAVSEVCGFLIFTTMPIVAVIATLTSLQLFLCLLKFRGRQDAVTAAYQLVSPMNGARSDDMVDERFVLDTLSMLVNVSLKCCDDEVSDVAHKLVFEILSSKAGPLHGQMLRMCSLLCTPSSTQFAKTVVDFMDRAYFSASDGSKSWLVQAYHQPDHSISTVVLRNIIDRIFLLFSVLLPVLLTSLSSWLFLVSPCRSLRRDC